MHDGLVGPELVPGLRVDRYKFDGEWPIFRPACAWCLLMPDPVPGPRGVNRYRWPLWVSVTEYCEIFPPKGPSLKVGPGTKVAKDG